MTAENTLTLTASELVALTGYRQPAAQLEELLRQGFWRARRSPLGGLILERAHFESVCRGDASAAGRPKVRPPTLRVA